MQRDSSIQLLQMFCSLECKEYFAKALFVVGELGWNDYAIMLLAGKSVDEVRSHVTEIVGNICEATEVVTVFHATIVKI